MKEKSTSNKKNSTESNNFSGQYNSWAYHFEKTKKTNGNLLFNIVLEHSLCKSLSKSEFGSANGQPNIASMEVMCPWPGDPPYNLVAMIWTNCPFQSKCKGGLVKGIHTDTEVNRMYTTIAKALLAAGRWTQCARRCPPSFYFIFFYSNLHTREEIKINCHLFKIYKKKLKICPLQSY